MYKFRFFKYSVRLVYILYTSALRLLGHFTLYGSQRFECNWQPNQKSKDIANLAKLKNKVPQISRMQCLCSGFTSRHSFSSNFEQQHEYKFDS